MKYNVRFKYHLPDVFGGITDYNISFTVDADDILEATELGTGEVGRILKSLPTELMNMKELEVKELS